MAEEQFNEHEAEVMSSVYLPDDIMELILCHLPAKSLVRFKMVSKSWCELIESPEFITKHYHKRAAMSNNGCLLIVEENLHHFYLVYNNFPWNGLAWNRLEDLNLIGKPKKLYNHCNGIICLVNESGGVELRNHAIKQLKTLPRSHKEPPPGSYISEYNIGLCFDPKSNEYKVLNMWAFVGPQDRYGCMNKVEVWTPGKDSWKEINIKLEVWTPEDKHKWRQIDVPNIPRPRMFPPINLKGKIYWIGRYLGTHVIVYFDMVREVFRMASLPFLRQFEFMYLKLAILNESIVVFGRAFKDGAPSFETWRMSEESNQVCWSKYMTLEIPSRGCPTVRSRKKVKRERIPMKVRMTLKIRTYPVGFWNHGELILWDRDNRLLFFNMSTGDRVYGELEIKALQLFQVYNESLISVNEW